MKVSKYLALLFAVALLAGCQRPADQAAAASPDTTVEPTQAQAKLPTMKLYFGLGGPMLDAELALTPQEERTGMMFRTNIQDTDSMLFVLPAPQAADFWMKNCPESISAAYITTDGAIVEIHHLEHDDTNGVIAARGDIRFVLETQDGWYTHHSVPLGTVIRTDKGSMAETFLSPGQQ